MSGEAEADLPAAEEDFADRLEGFFRANYAALVRQHLRYGSIAEVQDAIQDAMMRIYTRFADGQVAPPDNLAAYVNVTIRNILKDRRRDEVLTPANGASDGLAVSRTVSLDDTESGLSPELIGDDREMGPEERLAWKRLFHAVLDRLPERWAGIATMAMAGASPAEIGAAYERDGYVLRRYVRELICRVLKELAQGGDSLAGGFSRDFCG